MKINLSIFGKKPNVIAYLHGCIMRRVLILVFITILSGCSLFRRADYTPGIQADRLAYIPARVSILPCQRWPNAATYRSLRLSNFSKEEVAAICNAIDEFILAGFDQQPFMHGLTPKYVTRLLSLAVPPVTLEAGFETWKREAQDCSECKDSLNFYQRSIAERESWRLWLSQFSKASRDSDAIFIPFLLYAYKDKINDRGMIEARRVAGVSLMLIDTNNGNTIWSRSRDAEVSNKKLQTDPSSNQLESPGIDVLQSRLLTSDLWLDYPGRQAE